MIVDQTRNRPSALAFAAATLPSAFTPPTTRPAFPAAKYGLVDPNVNSKPFGSSTLRARSSGRLRIDGEPAIVRRSPIWIELPSTPRFRRMLIDAVSASHTVSTPLASFTDRRICPCGLRHDTDLTTPLTSIVLLESKIPA